MLLGWFIHRRYIYLTSAGMLMLFCISPDNLHGSDRTALQAEKLIEQAHQIAPLISAKELTGLMDSGEEFALIDVRTETEFKGGHLQNALWLSRGVLEFAVRDGRLGDSQSNIVLYCRSGNRSALAVKDLINLGFTNVKHLEGGFKAWFNEGLSFFNRHGEMSGVSFEKKE